MIWRLRVLVLAMALVLLAGCESTYSKLARVDQLRNHATLLAQAENIGNHTTRVPVVMANGKRVQVAVHQSGSGKSPRIFILLHGVAADAQSWRFVRGGLTDSDVMAVDLPGCGESDVPRVEELGDEGYSPTALARAVLQAVRAQLAAYDPDVKLTLNGHSLGGSIILRMFGDEGLRSEYRDVLDRVDSIVLIAPAHVAIAEPSETVRTLLGLEDWKVGVAQMLGITRELAAKGEWTGAINGSCALQEVADRDVALLTDERRRHAMQAMIRAAVPTKNAALDWVEAEKWVAGYARVNVPCLIVWGSRDTTLPISLGYTLQSQIPGARMRILNPAKHCLLIEQPQACVDLIRQMAENRLTAAEIEQVPVAVPQREGVSHAASLARN